MYTAAKTEMTLVASVRSFSSLQDRCRAVVARRLAHTGRGTAAVQSLPLPVTLRHYVGEVLDETSSCCNSAGQQQLLQHDAATFLRRRTNVALKFWPPSDANYWPRAGWVGDCAALRI